jgi:hypothetical protein
MAAPKGGPPGGRFLADTQGNRPPRGAIKASGRGTYSYWVPPKNLKTGAQKDAWKAKHQGKTGAGAKGTGTVFGLMAGRGGVKGTGAKGSRGGKGGGKGGGGI